MKWTTPFERTSSWNSLARNAATVELLMNFLWYFDHKNKRINLNFIRSVHRVLQSKS
jgi:hypothetical protein